jgi:Bacterial Ig-like domain (group 1)/Carboxypeptidase regulatory-like domain
MVGTLVLVILVLEITFALFAGLVYGQTDTLTITGTVTDSSGNPVSGANVTVQPLLGLETFGKGKTDANGKYTITVKNHRGDTVNIVASHDKETKAEMKTIPAQGNLENADIKTEAMKLPRTGDGGGGRAAGTFGPPPSTLEFSKDSFQTFTFFKDIELTSTVSVSLVLLDVRGVLAFSPTDDPNIFQTEFTSLEFEYVPFALPGTRFADVNREVLSDSFLGLLDLADGTAFQQFETQWLTTNGDLVATSVESWFFDITPVAPNFLDIAIVSHGTFNVVPELSSLALLFIGLLALLYCDWQRRKQAP